MKRIEMPLPPVPDYALPFESAPMPVFVPASALHNYARYLRQCGRDDAADAVRAIVLDPSLGGAV